jgi:hypothetical protein
MNEEGLKSIDGEGKWEFCNWIFSFNLKTKTKALRVCGTF